MTDFPDRLRTLRRSRGWTQRELAQRAGLRQPTVADLETGEHSPALATLTKLAEALGVEVAELLKK